MPTAIPALADIVNLELYPIADNAGVDYPALVARCRDSMRETGVCLLHNFVQPRALERIRNEAEASLEHAYFCHNTHNAYLLDDTDEYDSSHPRRRQLQTDVGSVPYDRLPQPGTLTALYQHDALTRFLGDALEKKTFYRLDDPLGALSINVFEPGGGHAWHFDESRFSVTLMVQPAEHGGLFQYVANLRNQDDNNYSGVGAILDGDESAVQTLPLKPGTLSIFAGRNTLHRVTQVDGARPRLVPVLCFADEPGVRNSDAVRELFWGRSA